MKSKILCVIASGLLAGPVVTQAAITLTTDTSTDLQGTFSFVGNMSASETQSTVLLLPYETALGPPNDTLVGYRNRSSMAFGTWGVGSPGNPFISLSSNFGGGLATYAPYSGVYSNGDTSDGAAGGTPVYWRFFGLQDTGGASGTFSGSFCFSTTEANCAATAPPVPLPAAAWLLLSGLGGLGFFARRRKAA